MTNVNFKMETILNQEAALEIRKFDSILWLIKLVVVLRNELKLR